MRTIAILFALVVIGAAAPLASHQSQLPTAILLFAGAIVALQSVCLAAGWLLYERRISSRTANLRLVRESIGAPATVASPVEVPIRVASRAGTDRSRVPAAHQPWIGRTLDANGSHATPLYAEAVDRRVTLDTVGAGKRIALAGLALSAPPAEPSGSRASSG